MFLALTRGGYMELAEMFRDAPSATLWVNSDVLNDEELAQLRATGTSVTTFSIPIDRSEASAVNQAVEIIKEHHPDERVWVER